jgi:hypothetical protein
LTDQLRQSAALARERSWGRCEGCGLPIHGRLDPHHRQARQAGGVHRAAAVIANDVRNLLALCRPCHDGTEDAERWQECIGLGWRIPKAHRDPLNVPALIHTVNGYGWWLLTEDGGYRWVDRALDWRITFRPAG